MSNNESPPVNIEYGVVCNDLGCAYVVCETADTLKKAFALLKKSYKGLGKPEYSTKYCAQYDRGMHGEVFIIIENPKELIRELDACGCRDTQIPSTEYSIQYCLDDKGDRIWDRYTSKFDNM
jgi:hypothetical protein